MPYITASIILQLLQVAVPSLEKLSKEGEVGQARITQYTRYLTVGLAFAQSIGYVFLFHTLQAKAGESVVKTLRRPAHLPDRRLPDDRLRAADVDRRADHPAGHRQRHLAADLRLDRRAPARRHPGLVDEPGPGLQGDDAVPRAGGRRRHRVRAGRPAAHPGAVRQARDRPAHVRGRADLPAAAREHGRRDPGDLRRQHHGLPADRRPARQNALGPAARRTSSRPTAGTTWSASRSSSSSSPTSTRPSRSTRSTRPTT